MKLITLKSKDIKEKIAELLSVMMLQDGFAYKKTDNEFVKKKDGVLSFFNLLLTYWGIIIHWM